MEVRLVNMHCQQKKNCPVQLTVSLFSGKWRLLLLWHLKAGSKRFGELNRAIPLITQSVLSSQLKELEALGIVTRVVYPQVPPRVEYSLSAKGESLVPLISALEKWGINHAQPIPGYQAGECRWVTE